MIDKTNSRDWKGIVIHHSASSDGQTRDWPGIVRYHTSYRIDFHIVEYAEFTRRKAANEGKYFEEPWRDVGYNGGVEIVQGVATYAPGRPLHMAGAHAYVAGGARNFNNDHIGLCAIGNFEATAPGAGIWKKMLEVCKEYMVAFNIAADDVIGHREVYDRLGVPRQKSCPGKYWSMTNFRDDLVKAGAIQFGNRGFVIIKKNGSVTTFRADEVEKLIYT